MNNRDWKNMCNLAKGQQAAGGTEREGRRAWSAVDIWRILTPARTWRPSRRARNHLGCWVLRYCSLNEILDEIKRRTMKPSQAGQAGRGTGVSSPLHSSTSVSRVTGRKAWELLPQLTQGTAAKPGLLNSLAKVEGIHLYCNIFQPRRHGHGPTTNTIQNKTMMPLPKELPIDLSVWEVTAIGCSLSTRDLEIYSELPQHFH